MSQHIRISQFVITWGPGSILEGRNGPRIIPLPDIGLFIPQNLPLHEFEISDKRMSEGLLEGNKIFRIPSNSELGLPQSQYLYKTRPFPAWKLCHNIHRHVYKDKKGFSVLFFDSRCPVCHSDNREHLEPVRFVVACAEGHLDDVNWSFLVHSLQYSCHHDWFIWSGGGGGLSEIKIQCPICQAQINLGQVYYKTMKCSGRYPEREALNEPPLRSGCNSDARIIQRQASNLRIPEIMTLFTVPPLHTTLHNMLQSSAIYSAITAFPPRSLNQFKDMLERLLNQGLIKGTLYKEILKYSWKEINLAVKDILSGVSKNYKQLLMEEFKSFIDASINGIPPVKGPSPSSPVLLEVDPNRIIKIKETSLINRTFKIVPVLRLRTVIVQKGYRREVDTRNPAKTVDIGIRDEQSRFKWYPGVEFFGEGIFIMLDNNENTLQSIDDSLSFRRWFEVWNNHNKDYPSHIFRDESCREELHPGFVWWHTLSHLFIRAISAEAGYSAASIRERVYLEIVDKQHFRGGILIYAVQPGSEGTLGGLITLVPHFSAIMDRVIDMLKNCSGDPLCMENLFNKGKYSGAACYGCLFVPETSCEHRNMWLDRNIFLESL